MNEPTGILDNVNHPQHYEGNTSLECIDVMEVAFGFDAVANFCLCNAFKYLWRYKHKNGLEDLNKAKWYLDRYDMITDVCSEPYLKLKELCQEAKRTLTVPEDVDEKLEYAFNTLHLSDREAAELAGTSKTQAWRYRRDHDIEPRGGIT